MNNYRLTYKQPFERDEDSGSGIGDHYIAFLTHTVDFQASSDEVAKEWVDDFLKEGSIVFDHHIDGDGQTYSRRFVELARVLE